MTLPERMPRDDAGLKALAKQLGCAKKDLMVLAEVNDPFNADTATKRRDGEWFAGLWRQFGYTSGVHNRRVHYRAQSTEGVYLPGDGTPYANTQKCWVRLEGASKYARDLALLDPRLFTDRRNPESQPHNRPREFEPHLSWDVFYGLNPITGEMANTRTGPWSLPHVSPYGLRMHQPRDLGRVEVSGYGYEPADQPYLLELWCEKSTMDDVLTPLCRRLNVNYTPGTGYTSKTRTAEMLCRAEAHGKPVRVFVLSDYDPAGSHMPAAIARNIEYYRDLIAPEVEIAVHHLGMAREWAERYELPRTPIKDDDKRKANFEAIHGEGCVELDALEALHPGALARELSKALSAYVDTDYAGWLRQVEHEAERDATEQWHAITAPIRGEVERIAVEVDGIAERYTERLTALSEELAAEIEPYRQPLAEQWQRVLELAEDPSLIDLPLRPEPHADGADESGWLYDSRRHWREQLGCYRASKNGGTDEPQSR